MPVAAGDELHIQAGRLALEAAHRLGIRPVKFRGGPECPIGLVHVVHQLGQLVWGAVLVHEAADLGGQGQFPVAVGAGAAPAGEHGARPSQALPLGQVRALLQQQDAIHPGAGQLQGREDPSGARAHDDDPVSFACLRRSAGLRGHSALPVGGRSRSARG